MKTSTSHIALIAWLITLAECATLNAQMTGGFSQINMLDGGYYPAIVQHWSGRLYGRTDGGGIYSSDNMGYSWTYLCGNMTTDAALVPQGVAVQQTTNSSSNVVLQACGVGYLNTDPGRGVWKSTNGGASWTQTLTGVNFSGGDNERTGGECILFHPTNDSEAWVGSRGQGLYESTNAGSTWTLNTAFEETNIIASICIHPSYPNQIFVGGDEGLWVSLNHGTNWTLLKTFSLVERVTRGADGTVYYGGVNNGASLLQKITSTNWSNTASYVYTDLMPAYGSDGNTMTCVTVLRNGSLVAGDFDNSTRISTNEGASFTTLNYQYVPGSLVPQWTASSYFGWRANSLVQDVNLPNTWYGGGGYGPMRTDDGGNTWQFICNDIGEVVTYRVTFHPTDPNRIYIPCADHAGAVVTDGGISGNTASMATPFFAWPSDIVMYSHRPMACYTNGTNRAIFPGGCELDNTARIYVNYNDTNWAHLPAAGLATNVSGEEIIDNIDSLDNPDDFLVVMGGNAGVGAGGIYRTTNAGNSFTQCSWNVPAGTGLGDEQYWFVSIDRDATNVNIRYLYSKAVYPGNPGGGFYISTNRGVNWSEVGGVVDNNNDWYGMIYADKALSGHIWLVVTGDTYGLFLSTNYGTNWNRVGTFINVACMDAINGNIVVYGEMSGDTWYKIYYSTNNGATWAEVTAPGYRFSNAGSVSLDPHRPGRIFIGTGERSVGIFTPGTPEQQWQLDYFMSTNSSQGGNKADPDGNGLPNLVQYALGGDPLYGLSSNPLPGSASFNAANWVPYATISTNAALAGQPVMRVNLPDPPPADILLQALSSTDLVNWTTNATRNGTNAWQVFSPALVQPGLDTNGRAIFDIGIQPEDTNGGLYQCLQVQLAP